MTGTTSARWYFPDWMSDPSVRACGLAARGLWMDCLCICAANKGRDHGFLKIAGKPVTPYQLGRLVGATEIETLELLEELESNAVFSRTRDGTIYNRRMVRAEKNRGNGRLGGNPNLLKIKRTRNPVRTEPNLPPVLDRDSSLPFLEDSQTQGVSESESHTLGQWNFETFWAQYPHKVGKGKAREMFERVRKKRLVDFETMMLGLMRYAAKTDDRPWCNPATWLYQERWLDAPAKQTGGVDGGKREGSLLNVLERISGTLDEAEDDAVRDDARRSLPPGPVRGP